MPVIRRARQLLIQAMLALATGAPVNGPALAEDGTPIRVVVTHVTKAQGVLLVGAYDSAENWLGPATVVSQTVPVAPNLHGDTLSFDMRLPPGHYALSVLQDLNGNRKLDTNFLGIPTEPSGSSNNARSRFSAPKFRDAVITVADQPLELAIRLE